MWSIFLMALFVCLIWKKSIQTLYPFLVGLFVFLLLHFNSSLYVFHIHLSGIICQYSLLICVPLFLFLDIIICSTKVLNFDVIQFIYFFFYLMLLMSSRNHFLMQVHEDFILCSLLRVL